MWDLKSNWNKNWNNNWEAKIWKHVAYRNEKEKGALLIRYLSHKHLTKLRSADPEPNAVLTYFGHGAHLTECSFEWRLVRRTAKRAFLFGFTTVDGRVGFGAKGERVVLIILHGYFICSSLITSLEHKQCIRIEFSLMINVRRTNLENFAGLLRNFWLWSKLQETPGKRSGRSEILQLET